MIYYHLSNKNTWLIKYMTNLNEIIQELQQLTEATNKDRTKISQIKELLPFIKEAKKSGISHKKIVEVLNSKGIDN